MNAPIRTHDAIGRATARLILGTTAIERQLPIMRADFAVIGSNYRWETFSEERMRRIASELRSLAECADDCIIAATKARADRAEAEKIIQAVIDNVWEPVS